MIQNKKGQFFVIALVLLSIPFFLIFTFAQTTTSTEVKSMGTSSNIELTNIANVIEEQNDAIPSDWFNPNWKYRQKISSGLSPGNHCTLSGGGPITFTLDSISGKLEADRCWYNPPEFVVTSAASTTPISFVQIHPGTAVPCTGFSLACAVVDSVGPDFYAYYGNPSPSGTPSVSATPTTYFPASNNNYEQTIIANCTQIKLDHQSGHSVWCNLSSAVGQTRTYNINFTATDLKYEGTMN